LSLHKFYFLLRQIAGYDLFIPKLKNIVLFKPVYFHLFYKLVLGRSKKLASALIILSISFIKASGLKE